MEILTDLQLSVSSRQPKMPVCQSSSAGGVYDAGKGCPHCSHVRAVSYQDNFC